MEKEYAKTKFTEYQFLELFLAILKKQTSFSIIDKKTLEEVLFDYYNNPDFKLLFEDIARINQIDNKRVNLEDSFMAAIICGELTHINDSTTGRYINSIYEEELKRIISNYDNDKIQAMKELVEKVYPKYIMNLEYSHFQITEETRQNVLNHPERHLNCPLRVFMGRIYTDEEWETRSKEMLSRELPGGEKLPVKKIGVKKD